MQERMGANNERITGKWKNEKEIGRLEWGKNRNEKRDEAEHIWLEW